MVIAQFGPVHSGTFARSRSCACQAQTGLNWDGANFHKSLNPESLEPDRRRIGKCVYMAWRQSQVDGGPYDEAQARRIIDVAGPLYAGPPMVWRDRSNHAGHR